MNKIKQDQIRELSDSINSLIGSASNLNFLDKSGGLITGDLTISSDLHFGEINKSSSIYTDIPRINIYNSGSGLLNLNYTGVFSGDSIVLNAGLFSNFDSNRSNIYLESDNNTGRIYLDSVSGVIVNSNSGYINFSKTGLELLKLTENQFQAKVPIKTLDNSEIDGIYLYFDRTTGVLDQVDTDYYSSARYLINVNAENFLSAGFTLESPTNHFSEISFSWNKDLSIINKHETKRTFYEQFAWLPEYSPLTISGGVNLSNPSIIDIYVINNSFKDLRINAISEKIANKAGFSSSSSRSSSSMSSSKSSQSSSSKSSSSSSKSSRSSSSSSRSSSSSSRSSASSESSSSSIASLEGFEMYFSYPDGMLKSWSKRDESNFSTTQYYSLSKPSLKVFAYNNSDLTGNPVITYKSDSFKIQDAHINNNGCVKVEIDNNTYGSVTGDSWWVAYYDVYNGDDSINYGNITYSAPRSYQILRNGLAREYNDPFSIPYGQSGISGITYDPNEEGKIKLFFDLEHWKNGFPRLGWPSYLTVAASEQEYSLNLNWNLKTHFNVKIFTGENSLIWEKDTTRNFICEQDFLLSGGTGLPNGPTTEPTYKIYVEAKSGTTTLYPLLSTGTWTESRESTLENIQYNRSVPFSYPDGTGNVETKTGQFFISYVGNKMEPRANKTITIRGYRNSGMEGSPFVEIETGVDIYKTHKSGSADGFVSISSIIPNYSGQTWWFAFSEDMDTVVRSNGDGSNYFSLFGRELGASDCGAIAYGQSGVSGVSSDKVFFELEDRRNGFIRAKWPMFSYPLGFLNSAIGYRNARSFDISILTGNNTVFSKNIKRDFICEQDFLLSGGALLKNETGVSFDVGISVLDKDGNQINYSYEHTFSGVLNERRGSEFVPLIYQQDEPLNYPNGSLEKTNTGLVDFSFYYPDWEGSIPPVSIDIYGYKNKELGPYQFYHKRISNWSKFVTLGAGGTVTTGYSDIPKINNDTWWVCILNENQEGVNTTPSALGYKITGQNGYEIVDGCENKVYFSLNTGSAGFPFITWVGANGRVVIDRLSDVQGEIINKKIEGRRFFCAQDLILENISGLDNSNSLSPEFNAEVYALDRNDDFVETTGTPIVNVTWIEQRDSLNETINFSQSEPFGYNDYIFCEPVLTQTGLKILKTFPESFNIRKVENTFNGKNIVIIQNSLDNDTSFAHLGSEVLSSDTGNSWQTGNWLLVRETSENKTSPYFNSFATDLSIDRNDAKYIAIQNYGLAGPIESSNFDADSPYPNSTSDIWNSYVKSVFVSINSGQSYQPRDMFPNKTSKGLAVSNNKMIWGTKRNQGFVTFPADISTSSYVLQGGPEITFENYAIYSIAMSANSNVGCIALRGSQYSSYDIPQLRTSVQPTIIETHDGVNWYRTMYNESLYNGQISLWDMVIDKIRISHDGQVRVALARNIRHPINIGLDIDYCIWVNELLIGQAKDGGGFYTLTDVEKNWKIVHLSNENKILDFDINRDGSQIWCLTSGENGRAIEAISYRRGSYKGIYQGDVLTSVVAPMPISTYLSGQLEEINPRFINVYSEGGRSLLLLSDQDNKIWKSTNEQIGQVVAITGYSEIMESSSLSASADKIMDFKIFSDGLNGVALTAPYIPNFEESRPTDIYQNIVTGYYDGSWHWGESIEDISSLNTYFNTQSSLNPAYTERRVWNIDISNAENGKVAFVDQTETRGPPPFYLYTGYAYIYTSNDRGTTFSSISGAYGTSKIPKNIILQKYDSGAMIITKRHYGEANAISSIYYINDIDSLVLQEKSISSFAMDNLFSSSLKGSGLNPSVLAVGKGRGQVGVENGQYIYMGIRSNSPIGTYESSLVKSSKSPFVYNNENVFYKKVVSSISGDTVACIHDSKFYDYLGQNKYSYILMIYKSGSKVDSYMPSIDSWIPSYKTKEEIRDIAMSTGGNVVFGLVDGVGVVFSKENGFPGTWSGLVDYSYASSYGSPRRIECSDDGSVLYLGLENGIVGYSIN